MPLPKPEKPKVITTDYWSDKDFRSYLNPIGRERINSEIEQLRQAGWLVKIGRNRQNKLLVLNVSKSHCSLDLTLPPEFPLNPPNVAAIDGGSFARLETLCRWNSLCRLTDVVAEAELVSHCPLCLKRVTGD